MYIFSSCATSGLYGKSMLSFVRSCCLPKWLCHFEFPPAMNENSCHYTSMLAFAAVNVLDFLHPIRCAMASHCCFNFQFFSDYDIVLSQKLLPNPTSSGFSLLLAFRSFRILHFLCSFHIENPKGSTKKLLELINEFSKVAGYKVNLYKTVSFLYTNNELLE